MKRLTHLDSRGRARMVDVGSKAVTRREAVAEAVLVMRPATKRLITSGKTPKGDVFAVARIAGIQAAKRTPELIPLCHPLPLTSIEVAFEWLAPKSSRARLHIAATVRVDGKTGVEMEALTAASVAGLTVYDMCKAVDREMELTRLRLLKKTGGKSAEFQRKPSRR